MALVLVVLLVVMDVVVVVTVQDVGAAVAGDVGHASQNRKRPVFNVVEAAQIERHVGDNRVCAFG